MRNEFLAAAILGSVLVAGCGTQALDGKGLGQLFGTKDRQGQPYQLTPAEAQLVRYGVLQANQACAECDVTGGGNGNPAEYACGDAKFGLAAITTPNGNVNGRMEIIFDKDRPQNDIHLNGPVEFVRCISITEGENGDTYGEVEFGGTIQVERGLGDSSYTFICNVKDYGEPNRDDDYAIKVYDASGALVLEHSCTAEDGNIQLHPTRFAQVEQ